MGGRYTMRVAQILPALNDGGVERSTVDMARYLSERGIKNWVVSGGGRLVEQIEDAGAVHVTLDVGSKSPWGIRCASLALASFAEANQITILHARSRAPAWAAWHAARRAKIHPQFITTFHGLYGHSSALKRWYNRIMLRGPLVIANSKFIAEHIVSAYGHPRERIHVAQRGVDVSRFCPQAASAAQKQQIRNSFGASDRPLLMMVARISRWKGHDVLIAALDSLVDRPWNMVFIGGFDSANLRDELVNKVANGPAHGRIHFAGSVEDVPAHLASADLAFSMASQPEAFGRAVIEAGACGVPVIASKHGGSLETVLDGKTGWLVPPNDPETLAATIATALDQPELLQSFGRAGRVHVVEEFSIDAAIAQEAAAYSRLLGPADQP